MIVKKTTALLLAVLLAFACALPAFAADGASPAGFVPVLRFVAASDTHVRADSDVTADRIGKMLDEAYAVAGSDAKHPHLDALVIVGDLTHDGTAPEFDKFERAVKGSLRDETQFLAVVAKNHDGYHQSRKAIRARCKEMTGFDADFHAVIGGYHFIGVSVSANALLHYDAGQMRWLKAQLDDAVRDDPQKPVFVMHHEPSYDTTYGSRLYDGWFVPYFSPLMKKYPQIVEICGHSHYPLNDPRSVWQGAYTAIGTGAIVSSEFTVDAYRAYHPTDYTETSTCWIIEANAQNDLRLRGMDVNAGSFLCDFVIPNPADPGNRPFTPEKRKAASEAPVFGEGAALTVTTDGNTLKTVVPAARAAADDPVVLYRIEAKKANGAAVKDWVLPPYYRATAQESVEFTLRNLPAGDYTVRVTAENAYGKRSAPLQADVRLEGKNAVQLIPDYIRQFFADLKDFFVHLFW